MMNCIISDQPHLLPTLIMRISTLHWVIPVTIVTHMLGSGLIILKWESSSCISWRFQ